MKNKSKTKWVIFIGVGALAIGGLLYVNGFTISGGTLHSPGTVLIMVREAGTELYIDKSKKTTTKNDNETLTYNLSAGEHVFVLSRGNGFWPWQKEILLKSGDSITLTPFFVSKTVSGATITAIDPEYDSIKGMVRSAKLPRDTSRRLSSDNKVTVWLEGASLKASWHGKAEEAPAYLCQAGSCSDAVHIFTFNTEPTSIEFYKDRADVILVAVGDTIGALELDTRGTQNFEPVYKGGTPKFVKSRSGSLFVDDGSSLAEINL